MEEVTLEKPPLSDKIQGYGSMGCHWFHHLNDVWAGFQRKPKITGTWAVAASKAQAHSQTKSRIAVIAVIAGIWGQENLGAKQLLCGQWTDGEDQQLQGDLRLGRLKKHGDFSLSTWPSWSMKHHTLGENYRKPCFFLLKNMNQWSVSGKIYRKAWCLHPNISVSCFNCPIIKFREWSSCVSRSDDVGFAKGFQV